MAKPWHQQLIEAGVVKLPEAWCDGLCEPTCEACEKYEAEARAYLHEVAMRTGDFLDAENRLIDALESGLRALSGNTSRPPLS